MPRLGARTGIRRPRTAWRTAVTAVLMPVGLLALAGNARADVITDVNNVLLNIIVNTSPVLIDGPPTVAREIAMVNGAMYNAVNALGGGSSASAQAAVLSAGFSVMNGLYGAGSLYDQYKGVTGSAFFGAGSPYAGTLVGPSLTQYAAITAGLNSVAAELNALGAAAPVAAGTAIGSAAGAAMIAARANDGSYGPTGAMLSTLSYTAPPGSGTVAGVYIPPAARPALEPNAGAVAPFVIGQTTLNTLTSKVPGPAALTQQPYALQVLQTECQGASVGLPANVAAACAANHFAPQTTGQAAAALYWNDPGGTYQPPGHWLQIADIVAGSQGLDLLHHAQEDALVGAAMSDAGSAVWAVKFAGNRWRPITAIKDCNTWNAFFTTCDPTWNSLIATPPHPDYLAGHPGFSGAAATVLTNFFGSGDIPFVSVSQAYCNAGGSIRDAAGNTIGCTRGGISYSIENAGDCNNAETQPVLNSDFTANPLYNASPLICPISETFAGFADASSGAFGSIFSRVAGGIHTPQAVFDALALGNAIGQAVANASGIPEPGTLAMLSAALAALGIKRRRTTGCHG